MAPFLKSPQLLNDRSLSYCLTPEVDKSELAGQRNGEVRSEPSLGAVCVMPEPSHPTREFAAVPELAIHN